MILRDCQSLLRKDLNVLLRHIFIMALGCSGWITTLIQSALIQSASADVDVDFVKDVQPIFADHCIKCHGPEKQESGLRLDQRAAMLRDTDGGHTALVPGHPTESFLLHVVRGNDLDMRMPPEGDLLSTQHVEILSRWIDQGAPWPGQMSDNADKIATDHWSFQPIENIKPPEAPEKLQPIDRFIYQRLKQSGLEMSQPADEITLIRRAAFVLTGLPPSPNQVDNILGHPEGFDVGYEEWIDQLLQSPRYGERWAQHWLDIIRWAETVGFETNLERPHAWPYRDWVIKSLNDDKPYDQFLFEQIAGDTVGQDAALGFLVSGPANLPGQIGRDEQAMRQARQDELDEVVRTVSQACFGLTIECARCHNHKFDPILQRDYYAMQAMFAGLTYGDRRWRGEQNDQWTAQIPEVRAELESAKKDVAQIVANHALLPAVDSYHTETFEPVQATAIRMKINATNGGAASLYELQAWTVKIDQEESRNVALASSGAKPSASSFELANQTRHFDNLVDGDRDRRQAFPWVAREPGPAWVRVDFAKPESIDRVVWDHGSSVPVDYVIEALTVDSAAWEKVADTTKRTLRIDDARPADQVSIDRLDADEIADLVARNAKIRAIEADLLRLSNGPKVYAASFTDSPPSTWLLLRGDPMQRAEEVKAAIPLILGKIDYSNDDYESQSRVALARHLINPNHPLTSRVIVNRIWQHHFGTGLVDSPSDFGKMGSQPTHPQLLDWLVGDFVKNGWSLKRLHRKIALSQAFRQSSAPRESAIAIDANSRLLWRFPPRRLEAEAIRDTILFTSGKLNLQMGGRGFDLFNQRGGLSDYIPIEKFNTSGWRRMIYAHKIRMQSVDIFGAFDCPDAGQMKPKRTQSITPIQSLSLFNSPFSIRQSEFFAERIRENCVGDASEELVQVAFRLALSRLPTKAEQERMQRLVREHGLKQLCRVLFNTSEFVYIN